jgi:hypothetical protein
MKRIWTTWGLLMAVVCLSVSPGGAQGLGDDLRINGFVSQGYLNTDTVDYLMANSQDGSAQFTEVAITVTATPAERLRIAAQFLARKFGSSEGSVILDWGYGDYRWRDALGVRAGKVKLPYGFYNELRDLDFLRTPVFLPQSVYNEDFRELLLAYSGVGGYGNFNLGSGGELDYHVYGGTLDAGNTTQGFWNDSYTALALTLEPAVEDRAEEMYPPGTAEADLVDIYDSEVVFPYVYGGSLIWNTPVESMRLGSTILTGNFRYNATFRYDVTMSNEPDNPRYYPFSFEFEENSEINRIMTLSGEYAYENLLLAGEYSDSDINDIGTEGWYGMADYRLLDPLAVAVIYSVYYDDKDNRDGSNYQEIGLPGHYAWQKDWTVAASYDITDHWLIKAEYHFINGVASIQSRSIQTEIEDPKPQYWNMFAAKTTFHF